MNLKQIRCFVAVAEELHFGRAAARLNMAQPPLSRHIRLLEEAVGEPLFIRNNRRVELSAFGRTFLAECAPLARRFDALPAVAAQMRAGSAGTLNIGTVAPALDGMLPGLLRRFGEAAPAVEAKIHIDGTPRIMEGLRAGRLHVGFVHHFSQDVSDLEVRLISREPCALAVPAGHALARGGSGPVQLAAIDGERLIFIPRVSHPELHDTFLGILSRAGVKVTVTQEANYQSMILAMVAAGLGVALVPASAILARREGVAVLPLKVDLPSVEVHAVWRRGETAGTLKAFTDFLAGEELTPG